MNSIEAIYVKWFPILYNYAVSIVKEQADAENIVGDVFLNLIDEWEHVKIETSIKSYLFKSVYNRSLDML
jgi:RNA polymerase sigma-70 factor (ECF subfamily)